MAGILTGGWPLYGCRSPKSPKSPPDSKIQNTLVFTTIMKKKYPPIHPNGGFLSSVRNKEETRRAISGIKKFRSSGHLTPSPKHQSTKLNHLNASGRIQTVIQSSELSRVY
ncbi:Hypothetical predicted protein [Prunus dulcis]|uniref:Uncharacterized protein n=1 Tax=Prunus dulcis TaxID=3755 RepID=A0A5E4EZD6_PRUDU|nr:Hypothetical predicted protein [Prunus dulcis]